MKTIKEIGRKASLSSSQTTIIECCMCGDYGFSHELFRCKLCHFRSQHRYCSNQYPKAETYKFCNWCLAQKNDSSNSSSSSKSNIDEDVSKKIKPGYFAKGDKCVVRLRIDTTGGDGGGGNKNQKVPVAIVSPATNKKRNIATVAESVEEKIRRTRSEDLTNAKGGIGRHVFRNKVRRYKLLDEVSS